MSFLRPGSRDNERQQERFIHERAERTGRSDGHSDFRETVIQTRLTSYDLVAYPSYTHPQTHPDRLAVVGALSGLEPAPGNRCPVLELGCGNGSNLLPVSWGVPESDFVCIDLASPPIPYR